MSKYIMGIGCLCMMLSSCSETEPAVADIIVPDSRPYRINTDGSAYYRTPAMVITKNSTVLAFGQARIDDREDTGNNDIVLRRSFDRGQTWTPRIVLKDEGECPVRGPSPIYLPETNRVVLLMSMNFAGSGDPIRTFVTYSDDEGATWAPEVEITDDVIPSGATKFNTGPGHGIVKKYEPNKGRLIVPCYARTKGAADSKSMVIYSDDNGTTWKRSGFVDRATSNECTVCELSDGRLMLNCRIEDEDIAITDRYRYQSISEDGGLTWQPTTKTVLPEPQCQGSIFYYGNGEDGKGILLFSNPANQSNRTHLTVRASFDDGKTWSVGVDCTREDHGSYSDIAVFPDGEIAVMYEYGYLNSGGIVFKKFKLEDLK